MYECMSVCMYEPKYLKKSRLQINKIKVTYPLGIGLGIVRMNKIEIYQHHDTIL